MVWLMRIWNSYENKNEQAQQLAEYLHQPIPTIPTSHRYHARMLYSRGMYPQMEKESKSILARIDSGMTGYERRVAVMLRFFWDSWEMHDVSLLILKSITRSP